MKMNMKMNIHMNMNKNIYHCHLYQFNNFKISLRYFDTILFQLNQVFVNF